MAKPPEATPVCTYGGDRFGNLASTVWRCNRCRGLFYTGPDYSKPTVVGLILTEVPPKVGQSQDEKAAEIYRKSSKCECDDRHSSELTSLGFSGGRPPGWWGWHLRKSRNEEEEEE